MAVFYFNPDDIIDSIYTILNDDSILEDTDYMNKSSKKIWKRVAPVSANAPFIVLEAQSFSQPGYSLNYGEVRLHIYTDLLSNGQIDNKNGKILERCEILLNNVMPAVAGAKCLPLECVGKVSAYTDSMLNDKAKSVLRFRVEIGKS